LGTEPKGVRNGAYRHGLHTAEAVAERRAVAALLRRALAALLRWARADVAGLPSGG